MDKPTKRGLPPSGLAWQVPRPFDMAVGRRRIIVGAHILSASRQVEGIVFSAYRRGGWARAAPWNEAPSRGSFIRCAVCRARLSSQSGPCMHAPCQELVGLRLKLRGKGDWFPYFLYKHHPSFTAPLDFGRRYLF